MDIVKTVVAATEWVQSKERKADTEGVGLEATIPEDLTQTGAPRKLEENQQLQPGGSSNRCQC